MRPDLAPVVVPGGAALLEEIRRHRDLETVLIRTHVGETHAAELCRQVRESAPRVRILVLLEPTETAARDACFRCGCDDVLYLPDDLAQLGERLAGANETLFRRDLRFPATFTVDLELPGGERSAEGESISKTAARVNWNGAAPSRSIVATRIRFPGLNPLSAWARLEDVATQKGQPVGIVLRFLGLTPSEREELYSFYIETRSQTKEVPSSIEATEASVARYERPPEVNPAPGEKIESLSEPHAGRFLFRVAAVIALAIGLIYGISADFHFIGDLRHPDQQILENPAEVVEGLQLRRAGPLGNRYVAMTDASWNRLSITQKQRAVTALAERARKASLPRVEVYDGRGQVAIATLANATSGGHVVMTIRR